MSCISLLTLSVHGELLSCDVSFVFAEITSHAPIFLSVLLICQCQRRALVRSFSSLPFQGPAPFSLLFEFGKNGRFYPDALLAFFLSSNVLWSSFTDPSRRLRLFFFDQTLAFRFFLLGFATTFRPSLTLSLFPQGGFFLYASSLACSWRFRW